MKNLRIILVSLLCTFLAVGNAAAVTTTATVTATVNSTSSISLSPATFAFGAVAGSGTSYRFRSPSGTGVVDVTYFAAGTYEIRVYTDNGVGPGYADARGFIRDATAATANRLHPKVWCPNISGNAVISDTTGPEFTTASNIAEYLWKGYDLNQDDIFDPNLAQVFDVFADNVSFSEAVLDVDINGDGDIADTFRASSRLEASEGDGDGPISEGPSYAYMRELDTHNEGVDTTTQIGTRCVLAWNTLGQAGRSTQDGSLGNPFPVVLGIDVNGVANGIYSSSNNGPLLPAPPSTSDPITPGQDHQGGVIFELLTY